MCPDDLVKALGRVMAQKKQLGILSCVSSFENADGLVGWLSCIILDSWI
jgi:hypothetical protein